MKSAFHCYSKLCTLQSFTIHYWNNSTDINIKSLTELAIDESSCVHCITKDSRRAIFSSISWFRYRITHCHTFGKWGSESYRDFEIIVISVSVRSMVGQWAFGNTGKCFPGPGSRSRSRCWGNAVLRCDTHLYSVYFSGSSSAPAIRTATTRP